MQDNFKYAVIIPSERDDPSFVISELKKQTLQPTDIFVITEEYIDREYGFGQRIIGIVNDKISEINIKEYDAVVKIDSDVSIVKELFEIASKYYNESVGIIGTEMVYPNGQKCYPYGKKKSHGPLKIYTRFFLEKNNWLLPNMVGWDSIDGLLCKKIGLDEVILPIQTIHKRKTGKAYNDDYHLMVGMNYRNSGMNFKKMCLSVAKALFTKVIRINKIHLVFYGYFK